MANKQGISEDTKSLITVLLLIFLYPIGVVMMWGWMNWKKWIKVLISLPIILIVLILLLAILSIMLNGGA